MEVDGKTAAAAGLSVATLLGILTRLLYGAIGHRITSASHAAAAAAAAAEKVEERRRTDTIALHERIEAHAQEDRAMFGQVMQAISEQTEKLGDIHSDVQKALGDRPTRDEVQEMFQRSRR